MLQYRWSSSAASAPSPSCEERGPPASVDHAIDRCLSCRGKLRRWRPFPLGARRYSAPRKLSLSTRGSDRDGHSQKLPVDKVWQRCAAALLSAPPTWALHRKPPTRRHAHFSARLQPQACLSVKDRTVPPPTRRTRPYRRGRWSS